MTASPPERDPLFAMTGDHDAARTLRENLEAVARESEGTHLGAAAREVLNGRLSPRDLLQQQDFVAAVAQGTAQIRQAFERMDADDLDRLRQVGAESD